MIRVVRVNVGEVQTVLRVGEAEIARQCEVDRRQSVDRLLLEQIVDLVRDFLAFSACPRVNPIVSEIPDSVVTLAPTELCEQAARCRRLDRLLHLSRPYLHDEYVVLIQAHQFPRTNACNAIDRVRW